MLNCHYFFRNSLCLILTLSLILLPAGCCKQAVDTDDSPVEMHKRSSPKVSQNTISSAEYSYSPAMKFLDDDELLCSLGLQTFQLDCPTASSNDTVFVQLQLPEQWTQDDDTPTLFYFPDGSKAMQLEILPSASFWCWCCFCLRAAAVTAKEKVTSPTTAPTPQPISKRLRTSLSCCGRCTNCSPVRWASLTARLNIGAARKLT